MAGRKNYQIERRRTKAGKQEEMDANNFGDEDDDDNFDQVQQEDANNVGDDNDHEDDDEQQEDEQQEEQETLGAEEKKQDNTVNEQEVEEQPVDEDVEEEEEEDASSNKEEDSGEEYKEDSSVEEQEEEEDEEEYEPEETTAKRGRKRPPAARGRASARAKRPSYGDDDDDSDSDFGQPKRRARRNAGAKKKKYQEESEEEEEFESEHSDEPSPPNKNKKRRDRPRKAAAAAKAKPRGRPAKSKAAKRKQDDDSEEEEEEFDEEEEEEDSDDSEFGTPRPKKTSKRNTPRSNRRGMAGSSEEEEEEFSNPQSRLSAASRRSTPSRFSAAIASQRLTDVPGSSEEEEEHEEVKPKPRNRKGSMSEEEFLADSESESSEEKANNSESFDDDSSVNDDTPATGDVGHVDDDVVGTADESSDEEELLDSPVAKKKVSQMDEISPRRPSQGKDDDEDSSGSDAFVAEMRQRNSSRPRLPACPSTEDAITAEPLPKRHVCYISPDGTSRQCFALETLRQIALKSTTQKFRVDLTGDQQTFLQPPHFRTSMSDDLLDQIASRFGREALELHGEFYRRKPIALDDDDEEEEDDIFLPQNSLHQDHEAFMDHLERYIDRQMGHQDIYTCPLCYSEMHRRIIETSRAEQDDESDEERENGASDSPAESVYDPMLVLGYVDDDKFEAASAFCFTKVATLKVHIREDHRVDTKGIQGNDMYARYKIRAPDGLLQRWLQNTNRFGTFQGDMRRYWNEGNNQSFVYLLQLMQRAKIYREILQDEDDEDRDVAEDYLLVARTFFESFADRVQHDWERLSSPFFKNEGEDLKGFLVDDDDEVDEMPHFIAQRELAGEGEETSDANDLVSKIQRKYVEHEEDSEGDVSEEDENAGDENGEDDSEVNDKVPNGYYSEVEEEDDWVKDIKSKRKSKLSPKNGNGSAAKRVGKKLTKRKSTSSPSTAKLEPEPSSSVSKKRLILEDSEDE